ncbi:hypothetical protein OIY81_271 [Cryptosporidium canis]|uniref:Uncharacterized protein n=1 Tax=Cryptosporidium canis TaxID=195482 RepID=A0ABQ8P6C4_9CRYT|nr:hypothetical protein OJ252_2191 [Cryptosporidium canis]KAJ1614779.1 hypothetical protein OIY81_271 [Cryptosporidium canis]
MQRSSSLIRPLKSGSFVKDKTDHKKIDDLPVFSPINIKPSSPTKSNSKSHGSKSKKYFIVFIIFALLVIDTAFILTDSSRNINNSKVTDPYANMVVNSKDKKKINKNIRSQTLDNQPNWYTSKNHSKKKSNLRKKMSEDELQSEYEYELAANPALENLDEMEIKQAIKEGTIEDAIQEAEEIEEILEELQEIRNEKQALRGGRN